MISPNFALYARVQAGKLSIATLKQSLYRAILIRATSSGINLMCNHHFGLSAALISQCDCLLTFRKLSQGNLPLHSDTQSLPAIAPKMRSLIALLGVAAIFATRQTPLTVNKHAWDAVPPPTVHLDEATQEIPTTVPPQSYWKSSRPVFSFSLMPISLHRAFASIFSGCPKLVARSKHLTVITPRTLNNPEVVPAQACAHLEYSSFLADYFDSLMRIL